MTRRDAILLGVCVAAVGVFVAATLPYAVHWSDKDEGYYLRYATVIAERGLQGFPGLFRDYVAHADQRKLFPPPLRLAMIALGACAVRIGGSGFDSLVWLSIAAFLGLLGITYVNVRALYGGRTAVWVTSLLAASPLHLSMARRAMADSLLAAVAVMSLWWAIQAITQNTRGARQWVWITTGCAAACLVKEEAAILIPIILGLAVCHAGWSARRVPVALVGACLGALGIAVVLVVLTAGGLSPAWETLRVHLAAVGENRYAALHGGGPWFRYLVDSCLLSPWIAVLFLGWLGYLFGSRLQDDPARLWALVPVLFLGCAAPFTKNARYALFLEFPLRFGAVRMAQQLVGDRRSRHWITLIVLGLVVMDLWTFYQVFVYQGLYDPLTEWLLMKRGILPVPQ